MSLLISGFQAVLCTIVIGKSKTTKDLEHEAGCSKHRIRAGAGDDDDDDPDKNASLFLPFT